MEFCYNVKVKCRPEMSIDGMIKMGSDARVEMYSERRKTKLSIWFHPKQLIGNDLFGSKSVISS